VVIQCDTTIAMGSPDTLAQKTRPLRKTCSQECPGGAATRGPAFTRGPLVASQRRHLFRQSGKKWQRVLRKSVGATRRDHRSRAAGDREDGTGRPRLPNWSIVCHRCSLAGANGPGSGASLARSSPCDVRGARHEHRRPPAQPRSSRPNERTSGLGVRPPRITESRTSPVCRMPGNTICRVLAVLPGMGAPKRKGLPNSLYDSSAETGVNRGYSPARTVGCVLARTRPYASIGFAWVQAPTLRLLERHHHVGRQGELRPAGTVVERQQMGPGPVR